jgi:hypothetical protein
MLGNDVGERRGARAAGRLESGRSSTHVRRYDTEPPSCHIGNGTSQIG